MVIAGYLDLASLAGLVSLVDLALGLGDDAPHGPAEPDVARVIDSTRSGVSREFGQRGPQRRERIARGRGRDRPAGASPHVRLEARGGLTRAQGDGHRTGRPALVMQDQVADVRQARVGGY